MRIPLSDFISIIWNDAEERLKELEKLKADFWLSYKTNNVNIAFTRYFYNENINYVDTKPRFLYRDGHNYINKNDKKCVRRFIENILLSYLKANHTSNVEQCTLNYCATIYELYENFNMLNKFFIESFESETRRILASLKNILKYHRNEEFKSLYKEITGLETNVEEIIKDIKNISINFYDAAVQHFLENFDHDIKLLPLYKTEIDFVDRIL